MQTFGTKIIPFATLFLVLLTACGHAAVSEQLTDARETVEAARTGPAKQLAPEQVARSERLLDRAEGSRNGSLDEQHYAYLADRQARIALAETNRVTTSRETQAAKQAYVRDLEESTVAKRQEVQSKAQELEQVQKELADVRQELEQRGQVVDETTQRLQQQEAELARREAQLVAAERGQKQAEQRAHEAMQQLSRVAKVQENAQDTVITLTGEVLFATDKTELLPQARQRLGQVANALKAQPPGEIIVEGHTDSQGAEAHNRELSQGRAESVRSFLESQGVTGRIEAVGKGEGEPIADNSSPEGRALNRRVEIIIPRNQGAAQPGGAPSAHPMP